MPKLPSKVIQRLTNQIPIYKKILTQAKDRDINEADTVTIIADMLKDVFGFDKYSEITKEFQISRTYCDLAVKIKGKIEYLLEVKAIGIAIGKESHIRQAVNYCAKQGVKWVVLTNGIDWIVYRVMLKDKVTHEEVCKFNFLELNPRVRADQDMLFMLCRRGVDKDLIEQYYEYQQLVNKFTIAAILMSDETTLVANRLLRKLAPSIKIDKDEIAEVIKHQVIKRELVESDISKSTMIKIKRTMKKATKNAGSPLYQKKPDEPDT